MDLSRLGSADIRFGAMPLCAENVDPSLHFGETVASFGRAYPLKEDLYRASFEEGQFDAQAELFAGHLLEPFAAVDDIASLLDYQERILEDRLGLMPADWAVWECIFLRDYEKALRYGMLWQKLLEDEVERYRSQASAAIRETDMTEHDRIIARRDLKYRCRRMMQKAYRVQRIVHLLDVGAYGLLHENIRHNIDAANAAFDLSYPDYKE